MAAKKKTTTAKAKTKTTKTKTKTKSVAAAPDAKLTLRTVAPVFDNPDDVDLRRVVADALLEQNNPWGEFITLQLAIADKKAKPADKKLAVQLARRHLRLICGPIAEAIIQKTAVFERGFLVECSPERRLVPRPDWEAAARAPHWATVRATHVSILTTPQWWVTELMKNPATRSLRHINISHGLVVERKQAAEPWRVVKAAKERFFGAYLVALAKGLRPEEQKAIVIEPAVRPKVKEALEAMFVKAGIRRP